MKKFLWIIPVAVILGLAASVARGYELAFGFDMMSGLPTGMEWITIVLLAAGACLGILCLVMVKKSVPAAQDEKKSPVLKVVSLLCTAIMLALAGYSFYANRVEGDLVVYIFAALSVLNAISFALLGGKGLKANDNSVYNVFAFVQVLWATIAVILVFRERVSEPIAEHFVFLLFAFLCILLFTYAQTGYVYGKNRFAVALVVGIIGMYFAAIELFAPFIASGFNAEYYPELDFKTILPLAAYLIYMPVSLFKIFRNENNIE